MIAPVFSRAGSAAGPSGDARPGPHSREAAEVHAAGFRENAILVGGQLELEVGAARLTLDQGDVIDFAADAGHVRTKRGSRKYWINVVMTYGRHCRRGYGRALLRINCCAWRTAAGVRKIVAP